MILREKYGKIKCDGTYSVAFWGLSMNTVRIKSYAKINFTLEIVGEKDGYHLLDSLVSTIDLYNYIVLKKRKNGLSSVTMHGQGSESIPPECNNALKAAERFSERFGVNGADITVYKNIPIGAGLGGSSADISGVLRGMAKLYNITDKQAVETLALELGSDTAYMLQGGFMRMQGRGERLYPLPIKERLHLLLLCPQTGVSVGKCFAEYDKNPTPLPKTNTENCIKLWTNGDINDGGRYLTNDLFRPAATLCDDVRAAYESLTSFSPLGVTMTGSGSCGFAWFESKELCEWAKRRNKRKARAIVTHTLNPEYDKDKKPLFRNPFALSKEEIENAEK